MPGIISATATRVNGQIVEVVINIESDRAHKNAKAAYLCRIVMEKGEAHLRVLYHNKSGGNAEKLRGNPAGYYTIGSLEELGLTEEDLVNDPKYTS